MLRNALAAALFALVPGLLVAQQQQERPTFPAPAAGPSTTAMHQLFVDYWEWRLAEQPELATQTGRAEHNHRWRDWSRQGRQRARDARREFLEMTRYINTGNLTPENRLSVGLLEYELTTALDTETWANLVNRVSQSDGAHNQVFTVVDQMPARTVKDYENIIARLRALPVYIDQTIELLREQLAAGLAQPVITVDLVLDQVTAQSRPAPLDSPLLVAVTRFPETIPAAERKRLTSEAVTAFQQQFVPSWKKYEGFLRDTYRPKARASIALTSLPGGRDGYARLVRSNTTTQLTAQQIHEIGLREVERIGREMEKVVRADGFTGTVAEYQKQLASRPDMKFTSQQEMVAYATALLDRAQASLPKLFRTIPRMKVGVRPIPADREASTASNYTVGTADGTRQAWFNFNTYRPQEQVKYTVAATTLHETVPGHHLQSALAVETPGLPEFRRRFTSTAYGEGWALYSEALGHDMGIYGDHASRFGQLATEMFRAVRLVVDTGVHALGWSRERAREYFAQHAPSQSLAEIDRYIARPAQALAYKIGELRIRELRQRAEKALGARFDIREFHDVVLRDGRLPLDMLEQEVNAYIAAATR